MITTPTIKPESQKNFLLPARPEKKCLVCHQSVEFVKNESVPDSLKSLSMACYRESTRGHENCQEELLRISVETERRLVAEESLQRNHDLIARSGLSKRQIEKTFTRFAVNNETREAFNFLNSWTLGHCGATLLGLPGVGKTHLLISFALKQMQIGHRVKFYNFNELVGKLRQFSLQNGQTYESELDKIKKSSVLILDDIGADRGTPLSADLFNCILEYRLNNNLPLFVTTNCSEDDLVSKFHERAYSRLKEFTILIQVNGADYRNKIQINLQNKTMQQKESK